MPREPRDPIETKVTNRLQPLITTALALAGERFTGRLDLIIQVNISQGGLVGITLNSTAVEQRG